MPNVKTAISLPDNIFGEAEEIASRLGLSRSRFYAMALESFIAKYENEELLRRIDAAYAEEPDAGEKAGLAAMKRRQRELIKDEW